MSRNEEVRSVSSAGPLMKTASDTPSAASPSKKAKTSQSSVSMQQSMLTPQKEVSMHSEGVPVAANKPEVPRQCLHGPDLYSRVLGPTADESILTGLQTVIDLCSKLRTCGDRDSGDEEPEREQDLPVRDSSSRVKTSKSQTERSMLSAGFQVSPSVKSVAAQTAPFPVLVSQMLQTVGLTPEMVSKVMQTSFMDEPKAISASIFMQTSNATLKSVNNQTVDPEIRSGLSQTSDTLLPVREPPPPPPSQSVTTQSEQIPTTSRETIPDKDIYPPRSQSVTTQSEQIHTISRETMSDKIEEQAVDGDEHKCISPPEPPGAVCKCCECTSSSSMRRGSKDSKSSDDKPPCVCGSKHTKKCKCEPGSKPSGSSVTGDHQPPQEVRFAVTKISKYKEFTTFEVMKSTRNQPRQMPKAVEGVFVLKKNGDSKGEITQKGSTKGSSNGTKNGSSRSSGVKNGGSKSRNGSNGMRSNEIRTQSKVEAY